MQLQCVTKLSFSGNRIHETALLLPTDRQHSTVHNERKSHHRVSTDIRHTKIAVSFTGVLISS
jgi:hypothetical protein